MTKTRATASACNLFYVAFLMLLGGLPQIPTNLPPPKKPNLKADSAACKQMAAAAVKARQPGYTMPTCAHCPKPDYSDEAFRKKISGTVQLSLIVGLDGRAHCVSVTKPLGYGLDEAAVDKVLKDWIFKPAAGPDGKPVAMQMAVEISFSTYSRRRIR